ncbi:hypothetical protein GTR04_6758 [Trichophyton interdigitale]|nr:hypothetical protein GY631_6704 [Trichophyton interdigitale]KAG5217408.1 hypothetical protein GY632_6583 [Trichophyton interdigitale]KAG8205857.1 hypothetical protein GTR04_6758 [Trichophyton interdigitale]
MPASDVETNEIGKLAGKSNNQEVTIPEPRISSQDWQMSSTVNIHDLAGNHPEKMFAIDMYQKESPVQSRELWSSDSSNASPIASEGSFSSYEDAIRPVKATGNEPRIPDVLPFSLLSSSINKDEARAYASRLCNVKESQVIDIFPCTSLQEGLLALTAKREGSYVARNVFQIGDGINVNKLRHAWEQVVSMNPILRTRIVSLPHHGIMQVVLDEGAIWTSRGTHDDMVKFNPDSEENTMGLGKLLTRFTIFEGTADNPGHLIWEIHHALYDGWSIPLLLSQVENAYFNEFCQPLEPMAPFIKYIQDRDIGAAKAFWNDQFANIKGSHFPPVKPGYVPKQDCQIVRTISELPWGRSDFTPGTIVRAAWSIVAANGADSSEALFGVVVTGRQAPLPNIEFVAGPTIATLPIRVNVNWNENHKKFLDTVQRQSIEMIPFEQTGLQHISKVSQGTATACQFQTLLVVQPSSETTETTDRTFLSEVVDSQGGSQWQDVSIYPLVIECQLESESLKVSASFDSSVIGRQKMELVMSGFEFSIRQLSSGSTEQELLSSLVHDYSGLNDIWRWNREVPEATEACIHDLISRQVQENPQAQAICSWDGNMTYHELDSLSTDLAYQLVKRRVAGTVVPLLFEKSKFMPVAALAVMKAGGGCLPVDIKQPYERLAAISAQADSLIIISSVANEPVAVKLASGLELEREVLVVGPDQTLTFSAATPGPTSTSTASPSLPKVDPSDILYVVFTSGSTGTPKGVINTHRGLCSAITYQQKALGFSQTSRVFDFASYAFDAAWCNLLHAFTVGGTLCIPSQDERENDLAGCIEKYDVTTVDFTPSVARFLGPAVLSRLSTLILGGEAVLPSDAHLAGDDTTIINVYGPAECTPTATLSNITKATAIDIGRGAGACTWIVDPDDPSSLVPVGTVGELWLEGPLVGGGYLNDPEKTASAFVQNPPWLQHGLPAQHGQPGCPGRTGRLYRTGDLVQYLEDGSLVFVGRKDNQVKIRGQRVELGEVEQNVLGGLFLDSQVHNVNITKTQVTAETIRPEGSNGAILVAFVTLVFEGDTEITEDLHTSAVKKATSGLSDRLAERLPVYMVPTSYIPILDLPMTATGKTDRKKLRSTGEYLWLKYRSDSDSDESTDSLNGVESTLQKVWMNPHGGLGQGVGLCTWVVEPDDADTLAPLHAPGELWLEGPLVGEGYLNDPIRTAVSFIEDPVWLVQGVPGRHPGRRGRVYRTGDLVKYQEDGSIAYLGRKDTQVKIRGQRVELGEVEHWIESMIELPNDSSATVQVVAEAIQPRGVGNPILATFVSLGGSTSEPHDTLVKKAVQGLNDRLAASLSSYLIPSLYIPLQMIPRMATGKIDRSRLRSIGAALSAGEIAQLSRSESERLPPQTDAERLIQALWADILEINPDTISADDSFFRIGGDSIGAMRLVGMARQKNFSLTVRDIFRHPVLRDMAAVQA